MTHALFLFDIDGTLLVTRGLGIRAMELAGQDLFDPAFSASGLEFAGCLDPVLLDQLLSRNNVASSPAVLTRFRTQYARRLTELLEPGLPEGSGPLPGVHALLTRLIADPRFTLGLLTGNFPETGRLKLTRCDIDPDAFPIQVWGDESPHPAPLREHLPPVALERARHHRGEPIAPAQTVIIGDTPHDIRCAAASGCRSIAVATGKYPAAHLAACGADVVFDDLSPTGRVVETLLALSGLTGSSAAGLPSARA